MQGYSWLAQFFARLVKTRGYKAVTTLDIGGSFGHDFNCPNENERRWPSWDEYFRGIAEALKAEGFSPDTLRLVIEPGTALIAGCADYYTRVIGKRVFNGERVLQIDGSRLHVDPHLTRESFRGAISLVNRGGSTEAQSSEPIAYLSGATCHEKDRLLLEGSLAHAHRGDLVKICKAGAYSYGLAPFLFIHGAPAVVLKQADGRYSLAQQPLSARDYRRILSPADGELNSKK